MTAKNRLSRLERAYRPASDPSGQQWTPEMRVSALRNISRQALARIGVPAIDPFLDLEGRDYLAAWWQWFLANAEPWPRWAQEAGIRIAHPSNVPLSPGR
jgi:hypothetical protein